MQGKVLFVGCSHTNGFSWNEETGDKWIWQDNNYAKIYAEELADKQCYIYSSSGAPNNKFPRYIRHMLNEHPDIELISIQSTYWDRWLMGNNIDLQFRQIDPGYFTRKYIETDRLICYDDFNTIDYNIIEWNEKVKWDSVGMYEEGCPELNGGYEWPGFETSYTHMKFHTEIVTHLKHEEYCKDIALIDSISAVPVYVWRINDRVQFPDNFNLYKKLENIKVIQTPANVWIKNTLNIDIETMKVDEEHYNKEAHDIIAKNFIPEIINGTN
jgi:hypothetical protein